MAHAEHSSSHVGHHIIPKKTLLTVFGALIGLTVLTAVTAEFVDIGMLNVPLALAIAGSKAALVVLFFMGLKYDSPVNSLVFIVGSVFVLVFLTFTLFDTVFRGDIGNVDTQTIMERQRQEETLRAREAAPGMQGATAPGAAAPEAAAEEAAQEMEEAEAAAGAALDEGSGGEAEQQQQ